MLLQSNAKVKLVRSLAVCEESSGPFSNDGPPESVWIVLTLRRLFFFFNLCNYIVWWYFQDIIQLHISCPSDKEEEKSSKDEYENEEKEKKDKTPRKMLSRGTFTVDSVIFLTGLITPQLVLNSSAYPCYLSEVVCCVTITTAVCVEGGVKHSSNKENGDPLHSLISSVTPSLCRGP